jgi:hypothetical protein
MRALILTVLALGLAAGVSAQEFTPVTCPDGSTVTPQMTITLPPQSPATRDDLPEPYFVSVITDESIPSLATTDENAVTTCAVQDGLAETVSVNYGQGNAAGIATAGPSPYSAWVAADTTTENTVSVGQMANYGLVVIEGGRMTRDDNEGDLYTFTFDPSVLIPSSDTEDGESWLDFEIALFSTEGTYTPGFSLLDETGEVIVTGDKPQRCVPDQCELDLNRLIVDYTGLQVPSYAPQYKDLSNSSSDLDYLWNPTDSTIRVRVEDTNTEGAYTLIVNFHVKTHEAETIPAQAIDNGDGSWLVRCNGEMAFQNGIKLALDTTTISPENPLTLTALGVDSPVTMVVFTSPTEGICVSPSEDISTYSLTLPEFNVAPTLNGAQVTLDTPPAFVLLGSAQPSPITLMVEGWKTPLRETLVAEENPDLATILQPLLTLDVTPSMINSGADIRGYAIAADDIADPAIGILNDAGQPVTDASGQLAACNNAGVPDECALDSVSLTGYSLTLAEGRVLPGASLDAMVHLSFADLLTQVDPAQPRLHLAAADRTGAGGQIITILSMALGE